MGHLPFQLTPIQLNKIVVGGNGKNVQSLTIDFFTNSASVAVQIQRPLEYTGLSWKLKRRKSPTPNGFERLIQ